MCAQVAANLHSVRTTTLPTLSMRKQICYWCTETIHRHLCLMNSVCKGVITENKLQSATVGLLYLMRNGIVVHELVVLPKLQVTPSPFAMMRLGSV